VVARNAVDTLLRNPEHLAKPIDPVSSLLELASTTASRYVSAQDQQVDWTLFLDETLQVILKLSPQVSVLIEGGARLIAGEMDIREVDYSQYRHPGRISG
jgi:hypothetical protein